MAAGTGPKIHDENAAGRDARTRTNLGVSFCDDCSQLWLSGSGPISLRYSHWTGFELGEGPGPDSIFSSSVFPKARVEQHSLFGLSPALFLFGEISGVSTRTFSLRIFGFRLACLHIFNCFVYHIPVFQKRELKRRRRPTTVAQNRPCPIRHPFYLSTYLFFIKFTPGPGPQYIYSSPDHVSLYHLFDDLLPSQGPHSGLNRQLFRLFSARRTIYG